MAIDINCDLGEYIGEARDMSWTEELMKLISSCNIACGFHSGDPLTISRTIEQAIAHEVSIGAHPSYPDLKNFGRHSMDLSVEELKAVLTYQISALKGMVNARNRALVHVKAHGALYHDLSRRTPYAKVFYEVIQSLDPNLIVFGSPSDLMEEMAKEYKIKFIPEGFADRVYTEYLKLKNRDLKGAVIINPEKAFKQVQALIYERKVICEDGVKRPLEVKTICVHGDNPSAIMILQRIRSLLNA